MQGDYWQYKNVLNEYYSLEVIGDTTMSSNGIAYKIIQSNSGYKKYSRFSEDKVYSYSIFNQGEQIEYDFTLQPGDTVLYSPGENDTLLITLIDIRYENIFGLERKQWLFLFDVIPYFDDEVVYTITDSIGLTSAWNIFESSELVGAIINGKLYGTFVSVEYYNSCLLKSFNLSQNFPNPFNPSTKIKYSIPQTSNVVVKVFDILGNEIETLVNEEKQTGTYEITWYAENLPSGVYFYRIQTGDPSTSSGHSFVETKKMVLLR
jgi:hypothetical protein